MLQLDWKNGSSPSSQQEAKNGDTNDQEANEGSDDHLPESCLGFLPGFDFSLANFL